MKCQKCDGETKVVDSREIKGGTKIRRRRRCMVCSHGYTTYELARGDVDADCIDRATLSLAIESSISLVERLRKIHDQLNEVNPSALSVTCQHAVLIMGWCPQCKSFPKSSPQLSRENS